MGELVQNGFHHFHVIGSKHGGENRVVEPTEGAEGRGGAKVGVVTFLFEVRLLLLRVLE